MTEASRDWSRFPTQVLNAFLVVLLVVGLAVLTRQCVDRVRHVDLIVAAGRQDGESYRFAEALKTYLEAKYNVDVELRPSDGTVENLALLRNGTAQLATAQADVALQETLRESPPANPAPKDFGVVAVLFTDVFQLLYCDPSVQDEEGPPMTAEQLFSELTTRSTPSFVYLPSRDDEESGGQQRSFRDLARSYGLREGVHYTFHDDKWLQVACTPDERQNLVFRIRAEGNPGVHRAIHDGWRLVDLPGATMLWSGDIARQPSVIPLGAYRKLRNTPPWAPEPRADIRTVEVPRLLLAVDDCEPFVLWSPSSWVSWCKLPPRLAYNIAHDLNTDGPGLANAATDPMVKRLFLGIANQNVTDQTRALGVPVQSSIGPFYDPQLSWTFWFNTSAEGFSFLLALLTAVVPGFWGAYRLARAWREQAAATLMEEATRLMTRSKDPKGDPDWPPAVRALQDSLDSVLDVALGATPPVDAAPLPSDDGTRLDDEREIREEASWLGEASARLHGLREVYQRAEESLKERRISEASFRTFNEVYAAARDRIESEIETMQRNIAAAAVRRMNEVLGEGRDVRARSEALFEQFAPVLSHKLVFSRDSFRTFTDVYGLGLQREAPTTPSPSEDA